MFNFPHSPLQNLSKSMKINISTLLLFIAICQYFVELRAAEPGEGSSEGESRGRGRLLGSLTIRYAGQPLGRTRGTHLNQDQFRYEDPNDGPPHRIVYYDGIKIKVWLDGSVVRKTIYPGNYIPEGGYFKYNIFLIRTLQRGDVTLVAYINPHEKLIGVRPPALAGTRYNLEPTTTEWYINYCTTYFKVDVRNSVPTEMSLGHGHFHVDKENFCAFETVAGITFMLMTNDNDFNVTGVSLVSYDSIDP